MKIDENLFEDILVYNISYKNLVAKPLPVRFDKIDGFVRVYDESRYLVLFGSEKYDSIYFRIKYLITVKSGITYTTYNTCAKIKVGSYDSLPLEKTMTFHNVIILIKSVFNKDKNNCYYNICLGKASNVLPKI